MLEKKSKDYGTSVFTQKTRKNVPVENTHKSQFETRIKQAGTPDTSTFISMDNRRLYKYNEKQ